MSTKLKLNRYNSA